MTCETRKGRGRGRRALPLRPVPARTPAVEREATERVLCFSDFAARRTFLFYLKSTFYKQQ